jgi:hypothetical protein
MYSYSECGHWKRAHIRLISISVLTCNRERVSSSNMKNLMQRITNVISFFLVCFKCFSAFKPPQCDGYGLITEKYALNNK